jgi:hypothetical protein
MAWAPKGNGRHVPVNAEDPHPPRQTTEGTWMVKPELGVQANWWLCMQRDGHLQLVGKRVVGGEAQYRVKWGDVTQEQEVQYSWEPASELREFSSDLMQSYDAVEQSRGPGGTAQASTGLPIIAQREMNEVM